MSNVKVAFLYSEVAGYFLSCALELSKKAEVLIFRWPVNAEAPFDLSKYSNLTILDRSEYSQQELEETIKTFAPTIVVCSGWMDKGYVKAAKNLKKRIPVVLTLDNHWIGSVKQRLASLISPFHLRRIYSHAWVPGAPQAIFAKKLGFKADTVLKDFYCADVAHFDRLYQDTFASKRAHFPKRFLFVARYVEHKGVFDMWQAFLELQKEAPSDWELWCLGTGDEWENRIEGDKIKHVGFVQPEEIEKYVAETGVYILPSKFEPWGVTVQEFAISGFPLLLSDQIGAKWSYLKSNENGFEFPAGSVAEIKNAMKQVIAKTDSELIEMGEKSHKLGMSFTPEKWVDNLLSIKK